jgi:AGZA family xanthine/uracil permease-like MFS transporter
MASPRTQLTFSAKEFRAALTTFLAMAYVLVVHPQMLSEAIPGDGGIVAELITVTALAAGFGSILMGAYARLPIAVAPGMGTNAYFTYVVVLSMGMPWQKAFGAVFVSGALFLLISLAGWRRWLIEGIPDVLKSAITIGLGLFLAFIGLKNASLVADSQATFVTIGDLTGAQPLLALFGLFMTAVLLIYRVEGAYLLGILVVTGIAMLLGQADAPSWQIDQWVQLPVWPETLVGQLEFPGLFSSELLTTAFVFFFVDFFDTAGTLTGLKKQIHSQHRDLVISDEATDKAFTCDAAATMVGAVLGTSTTTSYLESAAGIGEGGRTGMTAIGVGVLFLLALFFWPILTKVPIFAAAPILIILGASMMTEVTAIHWQTMDEAIPAFLTIIMMPLTFSIAHGIGFGVLSYVALKIAARKFSDIKPGAWVIVAMILVKFIWFG